MFKRKRFVAGKSNNWQGFYSTWQEASNAVRMLGIKSDEEYKSRRKEDEHLPSSPNTFYTDFPRYEVFFGKKPRNWLGHYPTWQDASVGAYSLQITNTSEYRLIYKDDNRLPSTPDEFYVDFPGWDVFLKRKPENWKGYYTTWREASNAAKRIGVKSQTLYKKNYTRDDQLPSLPDTFYKDFPGWRIFLGKRCQNWDGYYPTWQEASLAAQKLQIKSHSQYLCSYSQDSRLYSSPRDLYKDFPGWYDFLGIDLNKCCNEASENFYLTWQDASSRVQLLWIYDAAEYRNRYKEDSRLPQKPQQFYKDFPGWKTFCGKGFLKK